MSTEAPIGEASSEPRRGGQSTPGDETQLANEIISTINDYLQRYPSTTTQQVLTALDKVSDVVSRKR